MPCSPDDLMIPIDLFDELFPALLFGSSHRIPECMACCTQPSGEWSWDRAVSVANAIARTSYLYVVAIQFGNGRVDGEPVLGCVTYCFLANH